MGLVDKLIDGVSQAFINVIGQVVGAIGGKLFGPIIKIIFDYLTQTPYPNNIYGFEAPTNDMWANFYSNIYVDQIQILVTPLFGLVLGLAMFFNIFGKKQKKIALRRAVFVYPFAYAWWWFGGWFLKFNNDLANYLLAGSADKLSNNLVGILSIATAAPLAAIAVYFVGIPLLFVVLLIYMVRRLAIYAYMIIMPVLLLMYVVPIDSVESWAKSMMGKFVPLVFMTVPVALLIRMGTEIVLESNGNIKKAFLGLALMGGAAIVPKYVFSYSQSIQRAVESGSRAGRSVARGARGQGRTGGQGSGGGSGGSRRGSRRGQGGQGGSGGGGTGPRTNGDEPSPEIAHKGGVDFSPSRSRRRMSRRRRQERRGEKLGRGMRKTAGRAKRGAKRAGKKGVRSAGKNYEKDGNTAANMAKGAAGSVVKSPYTASRDIVEGSSKRMQKINKRMAARRDQIQEEFSRGREAAKDPQPGSSPGRLKDVESSNARVDTQSGSQSRSAGGRSSSQGRQTYGRNQSSRQVGSLGGQSDSRSKTRFEQIKERQQREQTSGTNDSTASTGSERGDSWSNADPEGEAEPLGANWDDEEGSE